MNIRAILRRVPFWAPFALAAVLQAALIAAMVLDRVSILREGKEVMLRTRAVDPRDLLRGDYVTLQYDISSLLSADLKSQPAPGRHAALYLKLAPDAEGFYQPISLHLEPPSVNDREVMLRGRVTNGGQCGDALCANIGMQYGIEKYFVPQGEGLEIEKARNQGKVAVVAAVTPSGRAAIKRLLIDGQLVYDEPLF